MPQQTKGGFLFPPGDILSCNFGLNNYLDMSEDKKLKVLKHNKKITMNFEAKKILSKYTRVLRV